MKTSPTSASPRLRPAAKIVVRVGAPYSDVTVHTEEGRQVFDLAAARGLEQHRALREILVDFWCKEHGHPVLYG